MKKRMRLVFVLLTGIVTLLLAHQISFAVSKAEATPAPAICDGKSRKAYEDQRTSPDVELSPDYLLGIAEDFLSACQTRLHIQAVAKHAARAALDAGQTERSLPHFEIALKHGAVLSDAERLDYILSLWLNGRTEHAWTLRDELIEDWLVKASVIADISNIRLRDGIIYKISFPAPFGPAQTRTLWLAQPHGEGWPAAISHDADPALIALMSLRVGPRAQTMENLTLVQCRGRKIAARRFGEFEQTVTEETAMETLKAYLSQPQSPHFEDAGRPAAACYSTERLFLPVR